MPNLPPAGKLLGLDLGTKTIGVAVSDALRYTATPLETIARTKFTVDAARLLELIADNKAVALVLGLPLNMDGSEGPRAQSTRAFARNLRQKTPLPIAFWDERRNTSGRTSAHHAATGEPKWSTSSRPATSCRVISTG